MHPKYLRQLFEQEKHRLLQQELFPLPKVCYPPHEHLILGFWGLLLVPHPPEVQELPPAQFLWDLGLVFSVKVNCEFLFISLFLLASATSSQALILGAGKSPRSCGNTKDSHQLPQGTLSHPKPHRCLKPWRAQVWGAFGMHLYSGSIGSLCSPAPFH